MTIKATLSAIDALVDSYEAGRVSMDIHSKMDLRAQLAIWMYRVEEQVREVYGRKALQYAYTKYAIAREIVKGIEDDKRAVGRKGRSQAQLETETMALDSILQRQKERIESEAEHESLMQRIKGVKEILSALQQEISIAGHDYKSNPQHQSQ